MSDILFRQLQSLRLKGLLEEVGDDPVLGPQLRQRLEEAEKELAESRKQEDSIFPAEVQRLPRIAMFLRGGGVDRQNGIHASIASAALLQFEKMFVEQALHDERESAKSAGRQRRPKGAETPQLYFTGTPRGSFGLEFSPKPTSGGQVIALHAKSLEHLTDAIAAVATEEDARFPEAIKPIPLGVLASLKQFMGVLAANGTELRIANESRAPVVLGVERVLRAATRMERDIRQEDVEVRGIFRGVTWESGYFDLVPEVGDLITGTVAEGFSEEDLDRINSLTNHLCRATMQKTTITTVAGGSDSKYVLLTAELAADDKSLALNPPEA